MALKVATASAAAHLQTLENSVVRVANVDLQKLEIRAREHVGRAFERSYQRAGWSQKECAANLRRDQSQIAKWVKGTERVQVDVVLADAVLWPYFVVSLAEIPGSGIVITTQLTLSRAA